jgi:glycosyltransferase involved in cell wall biosynthesis
MPIDFYRSREVVVVGADFFSEGGAWRSIFSFLKNKEAKGRPVHLIDLSRPRSTRQLFISALFSKNLLINGLASFNNWRIILLALCRTNVLVYLHDTEHSLEQFRHGYPARHRLLRVVLRKRHILCVSRRAETYYQTVYGSRKTSVVFECIPSENPPTFGQGLTHVMMMGSIDARKGAELFSSVADLAREQNLPFRFHWVGAVATKAELTRSPNVTWHGWQWNPKDFLREADIFLLSSIDDPLPLAALEALTLGKKCVVFRKTGISELIESIEGCSIFETYSSLSCLEALKKAASQDLDLQGLRERISPVSLDHFSEKIESLLE